MDANRLDSHHPVPMLDSVRSTFDTLELCFSVINKGVAIMPIMAGKITRFRDFPPREIRLLIGWSTGL